jgi:RsiW-degrading membrane proteinase PrsW (M82 family)
MTNCVIRKEVTADMFYFMLEPLITYRWILILSAVVPAIILMVKVYRSDRLERESPFLLRQLVVGGILATLLAMVTERIGEYILGMLVSQGSTMYHILLYFVVVGLSEEGFKYWMMKRRTWYSPEFNCQYDGVVYAVFTALGFALWENISYVLSYGLSTALVRAVTAVPGHACFGVFMGIFYGIAKKEERSGYQQRSKAFRVLAVIVPALIHGAYDYIASTNSSTLVFVLFIVVLFVLAYWLVDRASKNDRYI